MMAAGRKLNPYIMSWTCTDKEQGVGTASQRERSTYPKGGLGQTQADLT